MTGRYVGGVLALALVAGLAGYACRGSLGSGALGGIWLGLALSAAGAVSWIVATAATLTRGHQAFLTAMALGILGRLMVYGATLVYVAKRTALDPVWTAGSLLGSYAVFIVLEIRFALLLARRAGSGAGGGRS